MRGHSFIRVPLAALIVGLVGYAGAAEANNPAGPEQQKRLEDMRAQGTQAHLTVFPVAISATNKGEKRAEGIGKDAGKVLGVILEQAGMENLEPTDSVFVLPAEVGFDEVGKHFGEFVRANPINSDYALYAEVIGRTGNPPRFDELRSVVVDKLGNTVWIDRQTPDDPDFKRIKPSCLMSSCVLLAERVRTRLGIPESARNDSAEGKFTRLAAASSPAPDKEEFAAMEQRQAVMKKAGSGAKVAIYPVRLSDDKVSAESASHLATLLGDKKLCGAEAVNSPLRVKIEPARDEQKLLWDLARAFQDHVKSNPPDADYALLADYMMHPRTGRAWAVHFVVCDHDGEWVIVDFQNDHHDDFQSIDPKTHDDCGRLVARRLRGYLR